MLLPGGCGLIRFTSQFRLRIELIFKLTRDYLIYKLYSMGSPNLYRQSSLCHYKNRCVLSIPLKGETSLNMLILTD